MPTREQIHKQTQSDLALKNALRGRGDKEDRLHAVEHHFVADDHTRLTDLAKVGRMLGFGVSEVQMAKGDGGHKFHDCG